MLLEHLELALPEALSIYTHQYIPFLDEDHFIWVPGIHSTD